MRLIDADKLLPKLWVCYEENKPIVDAEPTVEAIPVEWIKDYVDFGVSDELAQRYRRFVLNMVKDWEKENE